MGWENKCKVPYLSKDLKALPNWLLNTRRECGRSRGRGGVKVGTFLEAPRVSAVFGLQEAVQSEVKESSSQTLSVFL